MRGPEINEKGEVVTFPLYCDHCGTTYWYAPNEVIADFPGSDECKQRLFGSLGKTRSDPLRDSGYDGGFWWKAFWKEAIEKGKEVERSDMREFTRSREKKT